MYSVNSGKTNAHTFGFFLIKLIEHLDSEDVMWRKNTLIMIENAGYHRGEQTRNLIEDLKIPIMYLGPYHFKMAPIEIIFNFIKMHDLNPL